VSIATPALHGAQTRHHITKLGHHYHHQTTFGLSPNDLRFEVWPQIRGRHALDLRRRGVGWIGTKVAVMGSELVEDTEETKMEK